jgi:hypothetical protein
MRSCFSFYSIFRIVISFANFSKFLITRMWIWNTIFSNCIFCFLKESSFSSNFNRFLTSQFAEIATNSFFRVFLWDSLSIWLSFFFCFRLWSTFNSNETLWVFSKWLSKLMSFVDFSMLFSDSLIEQHCSDKLVSRDSHAHNTDECGSGSY